MLQSLRDEKSHENKPKPTTIYIRPESKYNKFMQPMIDQIIKMGCLVPIEIREVLNLSLIEYKTSLARIRHNLMTGSLKNT